MVIRRFVLAAAAVFIGLFAIPAVLMAQELSTVFARPQFDPVSAFNPASADKILLGRHLFFDPRLSARNDMACASCHQPEYFWADPKGVSSGSDGRPRPRRTPSLLDVGWQRSLTWDGRVDTLEGFVLQPVAHPKEMAQDLDLLVDELMEVPGYQRLFERAFPDEGVSLGGISLSIAAFLRTLRTGPSAFDRWIAGDADAISKEAEQGFYLFTGRAACSHCHSGWRFSDGGFHNIGTAKGNPGRGRYDRNDPLMVGAFRTPGLRNVAERSSFMHDGAFTSLEQVLDHYDCQCGMAEKQSWQVALDRNDKLKLLAFLKTLSDDQPVGDPIPIEGQPIP
ncbi:cytochrome-c peroxidase [Aestuariispira insulae]|nr:cytochrome c peroxidase [Aestuariispira insulae]